MERTANPNSQPQGDGRTKEACVSIFRHVNDLDIRNGDFPLISAKEEVGTSTATFAETNKMSITGGFFPVGNFESVARLLQQRQDSKNAKEREAESKSLDCENQQ